MATPHDNTEIMQRIGLIINPIAGIGGRVGLKGSDGVEIQRLAMQLGAVPRAGQRAIQTMDMLVSCRDSFELVTYPGEMGESAARLAGFSPEVIGAITPGVTTAQDTQLAARAMLKSQVSLLIFAGGDGTARDIYGAVGENYPVLGIPAGVKIHSGVFASNPKSAGELARLHITRQAKYKLAEVMDVDENAFRQGRIAARLYGYLTIPYRRSLVQGIKQASQASERQAQEDIASEVIQRMQLGCCYLLGPGTTVRAVADKLGLEKTLLGVDVIQNRRLLFKDANEQQLLDFLEGREAAILLTPIGGQGYLLGRGNQQISPEVIRRVGTDNLVVIATQEKLLSLRGRPLLVDSGDPALDKALRGYVRVITALGEETVYPVDG